MTKMLHRKMNSLERSIKSTFGRSGSAGLQDTAHNLKCKSERNHVETNLTHSLWSIPQKWWTRNCQLHYTVLSFVYNPIYSGDLWKPCAFTINIPVPKMANTCCSWKKNLCKAFNQIRYTIAYFFQVHTINLHTIRTVMYDVCTVYLFVFRLICL